MLRVESTRSRRPHQTVTARRRGPGTWDLGPGTWGLRQRDCTAAPPSIPVVVEGESASDPRPLQVPEREPGVMTRTTAIAALRLLVNRPLSGCSGPKRIPRPAPGPRSPSETSIGCASTAGTPTRLPVCAGAKAEAKSRRRRPQAGGGHERSLPPPAQTRPSSQRKRPRHAKAQRGHRVGRDRYPGRGHHPLATKMPKTPRQPAAVSSAGRRPCCL